MILTVLFLTLVSSGLAQPGDKNVQPRSPRASQGQLQYSDPNGSKVDWKLYNPQNQQQTSAVTGRRSQRAETGTGQANFGPKQQVVQQPIEPQPQYQPFSAVPSHIKQLLAQAYSPQGPYVDPGAFFYQGAAALPISSAAEQPKQAGTFTQSPEHSYFNSAVNYRAAGYEQTAQASNQQFGKLGGIKYKDEGRVYQRSAEPPYGSVIRAQSQIKPQYQPYKQIQESQSQYQQYSKQASQPQPQYQQYSKQASQPQPQYQQYNKQASQSQSYNNPISQPQYQPQYQQFNKQVSRPQMQYQQFNKPALQPQNYKQIAQSSANTQPIKPVSQTYFDKNMPMAIQTLLNYQAQLPYNVIANHIHYRPKQLFIPKPLPESAKNAAYPSKIYFVKTDGEVYDGSAPDVQMKQEKRY